MLSHNCGWLVQKKFDTHIHDFPQVIWTLWAKLNVSKTARQMSMKLSHTLVCVQIPAKLILFPSATGILCVFLYANVSMQSEMMTMVSVIHNIKHCYCNHVGMVMLTFSSMTVDELSINTGLFRWGGAIRVNTSYRIPQKWDLKCLPVSNLN